ncbi:MAG: hypothetical protein J6A35_03280 [Paludibacteraceae bacterium]|nr:hypothetical protein [Paludibacteraceae bacterium]
MKLTAIQKQLMQISCPVHGVYPEVHIWGDQLQFKCCCEDFRRQLLRHADSLMYQTLHEDMGKEIRRIMKGKG